MSRFIYCYVECCYNECRYAECRYAWCRAALSDTFHFTAFAKDNEEAIGQVGPFFN
jgi:hypothetical protein